MSLYNDDKKEMPYWMKSKAFAIISRSVAALGLSAALFCSIYFTADPSLTRAADACTAAGTVFVAIGLFSVINLFGFFDFAEYGFYTVWIGLKRKVENPYADLIDFKEKKKEKRKDTWYSFLPYVIVGIAWLIAAAVLVSQVGW